MTHSPAISYLAFDIGAHRHAWSACINGQRSAGAIDADRGQLKAFLASCLKRGGRLRILAEATGVYYLDVMLLAHELGIEVMVINPRAAHHFAKALGQRSKTDPLDADMLLECLMRMPFQPWQPPAQEGLTLRAYGRYLMQLTRDRVAACNRQHAYASVQATPAFVRREVKRQIAHIDRAIARVRHEAVAVIQANAYLQQRFDALTSIIGVGEVSAVSLLSELVAIPQSLNGRACVCMAGLDPRLFDSGTSVHKPAHISRNGNAYLRQALFMPALSASRHDPGAKAFKHRLVDARGKKKMQANVAIMRKMLTAAWAMMKNPQPYDPAKLYADL